MFDFTITGLYRVQSRRSSCISMLHGKWLRAEEDLLSNQQVNNALSAHPQWRGFARVSLRPAIVSIRSGKFLTEPDILYKQEFFEPDHGTSVMEENIVDVAKATTKWHERIGHIKLLFGDNQYRQIAAYLDNLPLVVANEYYLHEAGHLLGYDVQAKYNDGYFSPGGRTAWPLIYLEELRADLHAFQFALELLPAERAVQVLLYNVALRMGVHLQGVADTGVAPYGLVPYLLYCVLREVGAVKICHSQGRVELSFADLTTKGLHRVMCACGAIAADQLTSLEEEAIDPLELGIIAATYVRRMLQHTEAMREFACLMSQASPEKP